MMQKPGFQEEFEKDENQITLLPPDSQARIVKGLYYIFTLLG